VVKASTFDLLVPPHAVTVLPPRSGGPGFQRSAPAFYGGACELTRVSASFPGHLLVSFFRRASCPPTSPTVFPVLDIPFSQFSAFSIRRFAALGSVSCYRNLAVGMTPAFFVRRFVYPSIEGIRSPPTGLLLFLTERGLEFRSPKDQSVLGPLFSEKGYVLFL